MDMAGLNVIDIAFIHHPAQEWSMQIHECIVECAGEPLEAMATLNN
jgi:hypothetical protein